MRNGTQGNYISGRQLHYSFETGVVFSLTYTSFLVFDSLLWLLQVEMDNFVRKLLIDLFP